MDLLKNIGINPEELNTDTDFIMIKDKGKHVEILNNFRGDKSTQSTENGLAEMIYDVKESEKGKISYWGLYVNGEEYCFGESEDDTSLQIVVKRNGKLVDKVNFVYTINPQTTVVDVKAVNR